MNFTTLGESQEYADALMEEVYARSHKFDVGEWKSIPWEMISFGLMLLKDKVFRLPFGFSVFGGEHDHLESQFTWPKKLDDDVEYKEAVAIHWRFQPDETLGVHGPWTKNIAVIAWDLEDLPAIQDEARRLCREDGHEMNANFIFKVCVDFGGERGWVWVGSIVVDQGGELYWTPQDSAYTKTEPKDRKLEDFFLYSMGVVGFWGVLGSVAALASKTTKQEIVPAPEKLNRARAKKGRAPIYEYRKITIGHSTDNVRTIDDKSVEGRASPRMHWRRGHYRTLPSKVRVPVAPSLVGLAENGFIDKDYLIALKRTKSSGTNV